VRSRGHCTAPAPPVRPVVLGLPVAGAGCGNGAPDSGHTLTWDGLRRSSAASVARVIALTGGSHAWPIARGGPIDAGDAAMDFFSR
jgi:hypothetical protein